MRPVLVIIAGILVILGAVFWMNYGEDMSARGAGRGGRGGGGGGRRGFNGPAPVLVRVAAKGSINIYLNGLGTVTPLANVTVRSQLNGQLMAVNFEEGQMVKKGDLAVINRARMPWRSSRRRASSPRRRPS